MTESRIKEIWEIVDKEFIGLKISKFSYCESERDYIVAHYFSNSIEACIEITKNKKHFQEEHRKLNIFHSYML